MATGLQDHFDWTQVAASAASAGVSQALLGSPNDPKEYLKTDFAQDLGGGRAAVFAGDFLSGLASGAVASVLNGGEVVTRKIAVDAFGNALGGALAYQEQRGADGTGTAKADDAQAKSEGPSATEGSSGAGNGDEDRQWLDEAEAKAKSDADAIAKKVIQQTNDWSSDWINTHPVTVASSSSSTTTKQLDPFTSMIQDAATCKTATDCATVSAKYDQNESAYKQIADRIRDTDPTSANFYDDMAKYSRKASDIAGADAAFLAQQQLQNSPPLPASPSSTPAASYADLDSSVYRGEDGALYPVIAPAAADPWSVNQLITDDPGTQAFLRRENYKSLRTLVMFGAGFLDPAAGILGDAAGGALIRSAAVDMDTAEATLSTGTTRVSNEVIAARQQLAAMAKIEPQVTQTLSDLAAANGGEMVGLQYRLKSVESLSRKMADQPGIPINDALRYTMCFDEMSFTEGTKITMANLQEQGYVQTALRNTFKDEQPYKGINSTYLTPEGEMFELQFHTPESFQMKDVINHPLYEQQRVLPRTDPAWTNLRNQMIQNSSSVPNPPGVSSIKKTR